MSIKINNSELNEPTESKFLGIVIHKKLKWKSHVDTIKSKVAVLTGIIYSLRNFLNINCTRQIYYALIYPHLLYCSAIWGGASETLIHELFIMQKKLMRIMLFKKTFDHTNSIFRDQRLLKLRDTIFLQTILFVHKSLHSFPIDTGCTLLPSVSNTRRHYTLYVYPSVGHAQQCVLSRGSKEWNNLSQDNISITSTNIFKCKIINNLLEKYR